MGRVFGAFRLFSSATLISRVLQSADMHILALNNDSTLIQSLRLL